MPKSGGKNSFAALRKIFNATGAEEEPYTSELSVLKKLISRPHDNTPTSASSSPVLRDSPKRTLSCLADRFVLQLQKASAKNFEKTHVPVQDSCPNATLGISSIVPSSDELDSPASLSKLREIFQTQYQNNTNSRKNETSRFRRQKVLQNSTKSGQFKKLMKLCVDKLDAETTLGVFGRVSGELRLTEYKTLIKLWIEKARKANGEDSFGYIQKAHHIFISMKERGFQILEDCYGPFLLYMIDMRMKDEFHVFTKFIKDYDQDSRNKIGYYEMLLWIKIGDECKIKELCNSVMAQECNANNKLAENFLLALCESDMEEEVIRLLEVFNVNIFSLDNASCIFKSIGKLQLENFAENFILTFKSGGSDEENISSFIYDYTSSIPNLAVKDIVSKFEKLHQKVEVIPTIASWDKLIKFACNMSMVYAAVKIAERMCESGLAVPIESFHPILQACDRTSEVDLAHQIYSVIRHYNLKPGEDTFKSLIVLYVKMKDFEGAYNLLKDAMELKVMPTASMLNALMAGYFREKNSYSAFKVLQDMLDLNIKPDSETYSYLISNCRSEEVVVKYRDEMQQTGVVATKNVYMALINAYANFGNFEKAKQVIQDAVIPSGYLNEIKSVLVSALSSNGQIYDALHEYDKIKQAGDKIEPNAAINLIEHLQSEGNLDRLWQLLDELTDSCHWFDGCSRVVLYCVRNNLARPAVDLLEKLKRKDERSTYIAIDQMFSDIWSMEPANVEIGMELLRAIKEELHLSVSRISLDFLLSTCIKAKDLLRARQIWSEYKIAGLPYNILTFLRMYQALLMSGDHKAAKNILKSLTTDDNHVLYVIKSCQATFGPKHSTKEYHT